MENVPEQFVRTNHTSQDDDDSTEDKDYVEALQEQELIELAMEMSLRDSEGLPSPCSSLNSTASFTSQRLLELLPAPLLLDETESERLDRLERELLEMVIQASQTDL